MTALDAYPLSSPIELSGDAPVLFTLSNTTASTGWRVETDITNKFLVGTQANPGWFSLDQTTGEATTEISRIKQELRFPVGGNTTNIIPSPSLGSTITFTLPSNTGTPNYIMKTDGTGVLSFVDVNSLVTGGGGSDSFNSVEAGGTEISTNNNTFQKAFIFSFPGTASTGVISSVDIIARGGNSNTVEYQLVDITNAQIVAGPTQLVNINIDTFLTLTPISNMPAGAAIFELQQRKVSGGGRSRVSHISVNALTSTVNSIEAGGIEVSTNNSTFQKAFTLTFSGTSNLGTVGSVDIIARGSNNSNTMEFRLVDITNANVVAGPTQLSNVNIDTLVSLSPISNMPTGTAIFQLQHRRVSGGGRSIVSHVKIQSV